MSEVFLVFSPTGECCYSTGHLCTHDLFGLWMTVLEWTVIFLGFAYLKLYLLSGHAILEY